MNRIRCGAAALAALGIVFSAHAITLRGSVRDAGDRPVADAGVFVNQDRQARRVMTDSAGLFEVRDLAVGNVEVVTVKPGLALGGFEATIVGDADVALRMAEPLETRLRVTDKHGKFVEGARIKSMFVGDSFHVRVEDLIDLGFPSYRSDADGYLTIPDLPKGSYLSLVVEHRDYADFQLITFPVGKEKISLPMTEGRTVRGRILSSEGAGVPRARVSLARHGASGKREFAEVLTDPEGFFAATVEPGEYYIAVKHPEHASPPVVPVRVASSGEEPSGEIRMLPPRRLEGTVVYADAGPAAGVQVSFVIEEVIVAESWTQTDGHYELLIPPVNGIVHVDLPRGYYSDQLVTADLDNAPRGEASPIVLKPLPHIRGRVLDSDKTPLPNALIVSLNLPDKLRLLSGADGTFEIAMERVPFKEKLKFRVEHPIRPRREEFEVAIDAREPVTVELKPYNLKIDPDDAPAQGNQLDHLVKKPAPAWSCDTWFNSDALTLESLRGKVVVLTLWGGFPADGGVPDAIREMKVLHEMLKDVDDVAFVGIHDNGKEPDEIRAMLEAGGIAFPVGRDNAESETLDAYNVIFIPQTVVIDQKGRLRYYRVQDRLLDLIKDLRRAK